MWSKIDPVVGVVGTEGWRTEYGSLKNRARNPSANRGLIHDRRPTKGPMDNGYINFHCQSNTPVAHLISITHLAFNRNIPLAQDRSLPA
jgi:hypothetical protein